MQHVIEAAPLQRPVVNPPRLAVFPQVEESWHAAAAPNDAWHRGPSNFGGAAVVGATAFVVTAGGARVVTSGFPLDGMQH